MSKLQDIKVNIAQLTNSELIDLKEWVEYAIRLSEVDINEGMEEQK